MYHPLHPSRYSPSHVLFRIGAQTARPWNPRRRRDRFVVKIKACIEKRSTGQRVGGWNLFSWPSSGPLDPRTDFTLDLRLAISKKSAPLVVVRYRSSALKTTAEGGDAGEAGAGSWRGTSRGKGGKKGEKQEPRKSNRNIDSRRSPALGGALAYDFSRHPPAPPRNS